MSLPRSAHVLALLASGSLACADLLGLEDPRPREAAPSSGGSASSATGAGAAATASSGTAAGGQGGSTGGGGEGGRTSSTTSSTASSGASTGGGGAGSGTGGGGAGGEPGECTLTGTERACAECIKVNCCAELLSCADSKCDCWKMCAKAGHSYAVCELQCDSPSEEVTAVLQCIQDDCMVCGT